MLRTTALGITLITFSAALISCDTNISATNPFDPNAPSATREPASIRGVFQLEGREDHSGITVRLDGHSGNSASTDSTGAFTLANVSAGNLYFVVAAYTERPGEKFQTSRIAVSPGLRPGENRELPAQLLAKAPSAPVVLDAEKTSDSSIRVFWVKNPEEENVTSYDIYKRAGNSSVYEVAVQGHQPDPAGDDDILSYTIENLSPYEQYSFKLTATKILTNSNGATDTLTSSFSVDDVFQFLYPSPASIMYLEEQSQNALGLTISSDGALAYTLTTAGGTTEETTLWEINIETEEEIGCAQLTTYNPDNGDTVSFPSDFDTVIPVDSLIMQQTYGAPQFMHDSQGNSTAWVPYTVTYLDAPSTQFSGIASLDLSAELPPRTAEGDCQAGAWNHTIVSLKNTIGSGALAFTFAGHEKAITRTCVDNECVMYQYDIVNQRLENPLLLWEVPFELSQISFVDNTFIAISKSTSQLFIGDLTTQEERTMATVSGPMSIATIGTTGFIAITGVASNDIAIINISEGKEVYRLPAQSDNPKIAAAYMLSQDDRAAAVLYVVHGETHALSMYSFTQPSTATPSPGHRYLSPLRCSGTCRIEIGGDPQALTISPDGSTVLVLDRETSNKIFHFSQTSPNLEEQ